MISFRSFGFGAVALAFSSLMLSSCVTLAPFGKTSKPQMIPKLVPIPSSLFIMGSTQTEREAAYNLDESAYGVAISRQQSWYKYELPRQERYIRNFSITRTQITNFQYAAFIKETGHQAPNVNRVDWEKYGLNHSFESTRKYAWDEDSYPVGRGQHPVVLVSHNDAMAYAQWLSGKTNTQWRLPIEAEWELAARGLDGRAYPWGKNFNPTKANSSDLGPHDTLPVGSHPKGISPFGILDMAGQVYEWTLTPGEKGRMVLKGGAWDDRGCGVCRTSARHHRRPEIKHTIIGFRLVQVSD